MGQVKIEIPITCTVDWNKMTIADNGKYCSACGKIVVDFTSMTDEDIKNYFHKMSPKRVCGHFRREQLVGKETNYLLRLKNKLSTAKTPFKYAALFVLGIAMALVGCKSETTTGETIPENEFTNGNLLNADTILVNKNVDSTTVKDTTKIIGK